MSNVIDTDWDSVMDAFRTGNAMRIEEVKQKREHYKEVFGATGKKLTCEEIQKIFKSGGFIIDVRNPLDFISGGKLHNSVNVPLPDLLHWVKANKLINKNTPILVYSDNGKTAQSALQSLEENNYANVTNIGTHKWYNLCS